MNVSSEDKQSADVAVDIVELLETRISSIERNTEISAHPIISVPHQNTNSIILRSQNIHPW